MYCMYTVVDFVIECDGMTFTYYYNSVPMTLSGNLGIPRRRAC